jgi:hypothetical protein
VLASTLSRNSDAGYADLPLTLLCVPVSIRAARAALWPERRLCYLGPSPDASDSPPRCDLDGTDCVFIHTTLCTKRTRFRANLDGHALGHARSMIPFHGLIQTAGMV